MIGYIFLISSIIALVAFNLYSKVILSKTKYENAYTIIWLTAWVIFSLLLIPFDKLKVNISLSTLLLIITSAILASLSNIYRFKAFKYEEISVLSPVFYLYNASAILSSILIFHSPYKISTLIGFIVILFGTILVSFHKNILKLTIGVKYALISSIFIGISVSIDGYASKNISSGIYLFILMCFQLFISQFILLKPNRKELMHEFKTNRYNIFISALLIFLNYYFLINSFKYGNIPQFIAIAGTSNVIVCILGIILLKETNKIYIKILATLIALVGVIIINI